MIIFRRLIAVALIFLSFLLFIPALLITGLNGTAANPGFYNDQLKRADAYNFIYDKVLPAALDEIEEDESSDLFIELTDFKNDIISALEDIFPPVWLQEQAELATGELIPYFRGSTDEFTITIELYDRVDPTANAIIDVLGSQQTYDYLMDEVITPAVAEDIGSVDLPFPFDGVSLSQVEITSALEPGLRDVLPYDWVLARFAEIVWACADYLKGDEDTISVEIDLTASKEAAGNVITGLADQKLEDIGITDEAFKTAIGIYIAEWVDQNIIDPIPDTLSFTEQDVLEAMGTENEDVLDDLRDDIANGYTITQADLIDEISEGDGNPDDLDRARGIINTVRTWLWALWVLPILMLLGAGFLIARSLRGKLLWFLGIMFVIFLIFYIVVSVSYWNFAEPEIQKALSDPAEYQGVEAVMIEKGNEILLNSTGTFFSGIKRMCLYAMIGSGVAYIGVNLGLRRKKKDEVLPNESGETLQSEQDEVLLADQGEALQDENKEVFLDENGQVVQPEQVETPHDDKSEVLQADQNEALQPDQNEVLQTENSEALQDKQDEDLQDENNEVLQADQDEILQDENDKALQDGNGEAPQPEPDEVLQEDKNETSLDNNDKSGPDQETSPDSSIKMPEE